MMKIRLVCYLAIFVFIFGCKTTEPTMNSGALSPQQLNERAVALWKNGKYTDPDLALKYVTEAIAKDPNYGQAYYTRGFVFYDLVKYQESIQSFTEALKRDAEIHETYNGRGWVYAAIGEYEKAIADYTKALEIKGDYKLAYNNRAMAFLQIGQNDKACKDLKKVCDLGDCGNLKHAKKIGKCD